ncbi:MULTISPECIES: amino acid permease [unclassified Ruegeria]|uniref:amino acid permease n=1 Tax=unclassified Ruegeria TaxID=2625375 RepID=UPI001C2B8CA8
MSQGLEKSTEEQPAQSSPKVTRTLGPWTCTALVVGNIIGSGFFLAPAALAPFGAVAIIGWIVMSIGALCLGLVFARLSRVAPETGGPYAYTRLGFGDFAGFLVAWGYWIAVWVALPAIALGATDYLLYFVPGLSDLPGGGTTVALAMMIGVGLLNLRGAETVGVFQLVIVCIKMIPFLAVSFVGLFWVDWGHFTPINPTPHSFLLALAGTAPFIMFAFTGVESATVPAGDVKDPNRTIAFATVVGTLLAALVYTFGTLTVMGVMDADALAQSTAPFSDAASLIWGDWAGYVIAVAAVLSSVAALNGWTLLMAQVPLAAARHGLFPAWFSKLNKNGVPAKGIVISMALSVAILLFKSFASSSLLGLYEYLIDLSIVTDMVSYLFCCCVEGLILISLGRRIGFLNPWTYLPVAGIAFVFSLLTIYGAGAEAAMWSFLLLLAGIPIFVLNRIRQAARQD